MLGVSADLSHMHTHTHIKEDEGDVLFPTAMLNSIT